MGASIPRLEFLALPTAAGRAFITRFGLANHDEVRMSSIVEFDEVNFKKAVRYPASSYIAITSAKGSEELIFLSYAYNPINRTKHQIIEIVAR